jgi:FimV-like protein
MLLLSQLIQLMQTYQLPIAISTFFIALLLLSLLVFSRHRQLKNSHLSEANIEMLAGDNVIITQLDLARAYLEMGKNHLAKSLLIQILKQGNKDQKNIARQLMSKL